MVINYSSRPHDAVTTAEQVIMEINEDARGAIATYVNNATHDFNAHGGTTYK